MYYWTKSRSEQFTGLDVYQSFQSVILGGHKTIRFLFSDTDLSSRTDLVFGFLNSVVICTGTLYPKHRNGNYWSSCLSWLLTTHGERRRTRVGYSYVFKFSDFPSKSFLRRPRGLSALGRTIASRRT